MREKPRVERRRGGGPRVLVALAAVLALLFVACGSDGGSDSGSGTTDPGGTTEPGGSGSEPADAELETTSLRVGLTVPSPDLVLPAVADQLGYLADAGLEVEIFTFGGGAESTRALINGDVDVVSGSLQAAVLAAGAGQDLVAFYGLGDSFGQSWWSGSDISSLDELEGKSIGANPAGSMPYLMTEYMLDELTDFGSDGVNLVGLNGPGARFAALEVGQVDAAVLAAPETFEAEDKGFTQLAHAADDLPATVPNTYITTASFLADNPNTLAAFVAATEEAITTWNEAPDEVVPVLVEVLGYSEEIAARYMEVAVGRWPEGGFIAPEDQELIVEMMVGTGDIPGPVEPEEFIDPRFITG